MLFNSIVFASFFPIVFILYWIVSANMKVKWSNIFIIISSVVFYAWTNWMLALLLLGVSFVAWMTSCAIASNTQHPKRVFVVAVSVLVVILGIFKYCNFFIESFNTLITELGSSSHISTLNIIVPIGISFYIFQAIGYIYDVYKKKVEHEREVHAFFAFMCFFPQLLSGPIARANHLLPQFREKREFSFDMARVGFWQFALGLFMKLCVAERVSIYVNAIYNNIDMHSGISIALAAVFYSIQIYCDFAGYSLMAIGCAKFLGLNLQENFRQPYFASDIRDFWHRWHISLSSWLRDYLYIPLGGSRCGKWTNRRNLMLTFLLSGLWHGAAWNFVIWGGIHGAMQIVEKGLQTINKRVLGAWYRVFSVLRTFVIVTFAWMFFRIPTLKEVSLAIERIFTQGGTLFIDVETFGYAFTSIAILLVVDLMKERNMFDILERRYSKFWTYRILCLVVAVLFVQWICLSGVLDGSQFIYFQF